MIIYSDNDFFKLSKNDLKKYVIFTGYKGDIPIKKKDLIKTIKYKSPLYNKYRELYNTIIENPDKNLTIEQKNVYKSIVSFMTGIVEHKNIINLLNTFFIQDISNMIISRIDYMDYPKSKNRLSLLSGGAGTGKTYLISSVISKLAMLIEETNNINNIIHSVGNEIEDNVENEIKLYDNMDIHVLAPTNKAIKVIKNKINTILIKNKISTSIVNYFTISKFLQQDIEYTSEGKVVYKTKLNIKKNYYEKIKYIIIDESSMISRNNWKDLNKLIFQRLPNVKILLIGDECQLPPVKEKSSVVFNIRLKRFILNTVVRTCSKDLTDIYNKYRYSVKNNTKVDIDNSISDDFTYITSFKNVIKKEFDVFNDKIISYSNDSVDKYNEIVRNIVFNNPVEKYVSGEKIIFGSSIRCYNINNFVLEAKHCFYANDEATVISVEKIKLNTKFINDEKYNLETLFPEELFNVYKLSINIDNRIVIVYKVIDNDINKFNMYFENIYEKIKELSTNKNMKREYMSKLWNIFYTIKNTINIPIKYSYALTVYKAQGSTFKKIFVDLEDIHDCVKEIEVLHKTLYTAITRASEKIRCYKPTTNDYYYTDIEQHPFLDKYTIVDHKRVYKVFKNGQSIIYTRNEYQNKNIRKIVRCRIINIINKVIHVGNNNFTWELKLKDDIIIYI